MTRIEEYYQPILDGLDSAIVNGMGYSVQDMQTIATVTSDASWLFVASETTTVSIASLYKLKSSLNGSFEVFEDPDISTTTSYGTEQTIYNLNRNFNTLRTTTSQFFRTPTVNTTGVNRITVNVVGSDGVNPVGGTGGISEGEGFFIFMRGSKYLFRYTSENSDNRVSLCLTFVIGPSREALGG